MPKNWYTILSLSRALRTPRRSSESNREGTKKEATQKSRFFFLSLPGLTPNYAVACAMHVNERERHANFSACLVSFRLKFSHNVAGERGSVNASTGI